MSSKLNKVFLQGNLTKDPDYRDFGNSTGGMCTLRVASSQEYTDKNGQKHETTVYAEVEAYRKLASICRQYLSKGSAVIIEGKLVLKQWEKDGKQFSKLVIGAENIQFLNPARQSAPEPQQQQPQNRNTHRSVDSAYAPPPMPETNSDYPQEEDDIPF
jgi:single-strand DNA-binding protein